MLPWLPTPGTPGFATLCKVLSAHGLSPVGIELEAPTIRLNDVVLSLSLLGERLKVRLSYGWIEFLINNLYEGDDEALIDIANHLFTVLREIDTELSQAVSRYRCYAHLKLAPLQVDAFMKDHLGCKETSSELLPDAFAYELKWDQLKAGEQARIVVAKSSQFQDALFVDLTIEYVSPGEPAQILERINQDYERAIGSIGLKS